MNFNDEKDQELLLLDLTSRAPYGVMVDEFPYVGASKLYYVDSFRFRYRTDANEGERHLFERNAVGDTISRIKPYLRPLSSMTENEKKQFLKYFEFESVSDVVAIFQAKEPVDKIFIDFRYIADIIDWLNKHHFDYRGLIEKGIALEAPADMYTF